MLITADGSFRGGKRIALKQFADEALQGAPYVEAVVVVRRLGSDVPMQASRDIFWCTADIGWVTAHSYLIYGPLLHGTTNIPFEGTPTYPTVEHR